MCVLKGFGYTYILVWKFWVELSILIKKMVCRSVYEVKLVLSKEGAKDSLTV